MPRTIDKFERTWSLSSKFNDGLVVPREGSWAVPTHDIGHEFTVKTKQGKVIQTVAERVFGNSQSWLKIHNLDWKILEKFKFFEWNWSMHFEFWSWLNANQFIHSSSLRLPLKVNLKAMKSHDDITTARTYPDQRPGFHPSAELSKLSSLRTCKGLLGQSVKLMRRFDTQEADFKADPGRSGIKDYSQFH